jgi:hypothetical protein
MPKQNEAALALMREAATKPPPADKLDKLKRKIVELRDLETQKASLEERGKQIGGQIYELKTSELVSLFDEAGVDNVGIPEEGNLPAYNVEVGWHYKANIGSAAEPKVDDYEGAIAYLRKNQPDLLKTTYSVSFGMNEGKRQKEFEALLKKNKFDYSSNFGVPWAALTAWVKEQVGVHKKSLPLKLLGATVERTAQLIKPKAERAKKAAVEAKLTPKKGK